MTETARVTVECGSIDSAYRGVADPQLDVEFLQTEEERAQYEPIMQRLVEEGLPSEGASISGI